MFCLKNIEYAEGSIYFAKNYLFYLVILEVHGNKKYEQKVKQCKRTMKFFCY